MNWKSLVVSSGAPSMFLGLTLEYLGLPVPGETILMLAGALTGTGALPWAEVLGASVAGSTLGSWIAYRVGRFVPRETLMRLVSRIGVNTEEWEKAERALMTKRVPILLFSRYIPGVRHVVPYAAGMARMPERVFVLLNIISAFLWCGSLLLAGRVVGKEWAKLGAKFHQVGLLILAVAVVVLAVAWLQTRLKKHGDDKGSK